jgi:hypothetical protein
MQEDALPSHGLMRHERRGTDRVCALRNEDSGPLNIVKAWYLYALHLLLCSLFIIIMIGLVDGSDFRTGLRTDESTSQLDTLFFQTEINGLVSVALVLVRLLTGSAATLTVWRWAFILLEKCGVTLSELLRLLDQRLPFRPRFETRTQFLWSTVTILVMMLSWPPSFAAPLANSSLAWIPSGRLLNKLQDFELASLDENPDWPGVVGSRAQQQTRVYTMLQANFMAAQDPAYAFDDAALPLQRIFKSHEPISIGSKANLIVPYFDVTGIRWLDAKDGFPSIGDFTLTTITGLWNINRADGSVTLYRETQYDPSAASDFPKAEVFNGKQYVFLRVDYLGKEKGYKNDSSCPQLSPWLGQLPNVQQHEISFYDGDSMFQARDCYIVGEANIVAGQYAAQNCNVTYSTNSQNAATCSVDRSSAQPSPDTRTNYTIESMSEIMRNMMPLGVTKDYMKLGLDAYTKGMLRIAYHASWSSITEHLTRSNETAQFNIMEPVVRASVNRSRLYAWLGMNISLAVCAAFVSLVQRRTSTKAIRDVALAALTMDLSDVCHQSRTSGLCNAVVLSAKDKTLPRLVWDRAVRATGSDDDIDLSAKRTCERKVVFVDDIDLR